MMLAAQPGDGEDGAEVRRIGPAHDVRGPVAHQRLPGDRACALAERRFQFDVERAIFASVLHRIMVSGSDRAALRVGCATRSSTGRPGWNSSTCTGRWRGLGEPLPQADQHHATHAPRCVKDVFEETLFARERDLFT